jgi:hypothetical protein
MAALEGFGAACEELLAFVQRPHRQTKIFALPGGTNRNRDRLRSIVVWFGVVATGAR